MVTLQILVLSFLVRIQVAQLKRSSLSIAFFVADGGGGGWRSVAWAWRGRGVGVARVWRGAVDRTR